MKHVWLPALLALCAATTSHAQDLATNNQQIAATTAFSSPNQPSASSTSGSPEIVNAVGPSGFRLLFSGLRPAALTPEAFTLAPKSTSTAWNVPSPEPSPRPEPKFVYGARDDYRWQLGLGISLVRFRSSRYYATGVGTNTSLGYFTNEWLAVQGEVTTAFAPTIFQNEHIKFVSYGVGPLIAWRQRKIEPWMHALFGGVHVLPQTAGFGKNAFAAQIGTGIDYRFYPHLSARVELDWVRSHLFGEWQDSVQTALDLVLHF